MADHDHDHDHKHDNKDEPGRSIAALFESREEARSATAALHKAKYTHTWMGTTSIAATSTGDTAVTVETGGFFSGTQSLTDALVSRGVLGDVARELETRVEPGNTILTLDPKDHDVVDALDIINKHGGRTMDDVGTAWGEWPAASESSGMVDDGFAYDEELFVTRR